MTESFTYQNEEYQLDILGEENTETLVLLHGFLSSKAGWMGWEREMAQQYRVVNVTIPGHAGQNSLSYSSIDELVDFLFVAFKKFKINQFHLLGHSLGGYIALEYANQFEHQLKSIALLHSHPWADNEAGVKKRNHMIQLIERGFKKRVSQLTIPNLVCPENRPLLKPLLERANEIANDSSEEGLKSALIAMRDRHDRTAILKNEKLPIFWLSGAFDTFYPPQKAVNFQKETSIKHVLLDNCAHAAFMEDPKNLSLHYHRFLKTVE